MDGAAPELGQDDPLREKRNPDVVSCLDTVLALALALALALMQTPTLQFPQTGACEIETLGE